MSRILVVDDDSQGLYLLQVLLEGHNHQVETAINGQEALDKARANRPDVIISDVLMPVMDGFTLCRVWKTDEQLRGIPFVLYTATYTDPSDEELALNSGAERFIAKPMEPTDLVKILEEVITEAAEGRLAKAQDPIAEESVYLKMYNQRLINKLEDKMLQLEEANLSLSHQLRLYRAVLEHSADAIISLDPEHKIVAWSAGAERILGYTDEEVLGQSMDILVPTDEQQSTAEMLKTVSQEGFVHNWHSRRRAKNGQQIDLEETVTNLGPDLGYTAILSDITERRRMEKERERLVTAIEQAAEAVVITDIDGIIQYVNPAFEQITGYTREEATGQNPRILKSGQHAPSFYQEMWDTLARGEIWSGHLVNRKKDGTLYDEETSISPIQDAEGNTVSYVAVKRDVTKETALEAELQQAQKMEAVGRLAGGVAHDFNNLLTAILGYAQLALMELPFQSPMQRYIQEISNAGERAASLTRQLLAFSRKQVLQPQALSLNELLTSLETMLGRLIGEDIELRMVLESALGQVRADPGQIDQIIMNLAVNARDAMPRGGTLTIETANVELDEMYSATHVDVQPGPYVMLAVSDTGTGMDAEIQSHIFEPFFTTKDDQGTGLGLSTVYGIVKQSNGSIWVCSKPGHGTIFRIYLPQIGSLSSEMAQSESSSGTVSGSETILLVEDESVVRDLAYRILHQNGYKVLAASNAGEALLICEQHEEQIHLLLTDVVMPQMGGRELAERLQPMQPEMKVLYMSGYTDDMILHHGVLDEGTPFLEKPFAAQALLLKVRKLLDA